MDDDQYDEATGADDGAAALAARDNCNANAIDWRAEARRLQALLRAERSDMFAARQALLAEGIRVSEVARLARAALRWVTNEQERDRLRIELETWPRCLQCGAHHPPTFRWRDRERGWHRMQGATS
jgi:hypothetical protein